jgi:3-hydroxyisobutyrate dehydrogenase-like beta-hydroxyacid dehydrogenase
MDYSTALWLRLALDLASQHGVELPTSTAANNIYVKAMDAPLNAGDDDFSAVYKAV